MSIANPYEPALSQIYMKWESGPVEVYPWFVHVRFSLKFISEQSCMSQLKAISCYITEMGKWSGRDAPTHVVLSTVQLWKDNRIAYDLSA